VGEYITSLLTRAREVSNEAFLKATAASFREAWRIVDVVLEIAKTRPDATVSQTRAEDVVYVHHIWP
jgi:recyclin-1